MVKLSTFISLSTPFGVASAMKRNQNIAKRSSLNFIFFPYYKLFSEFGKYMHAAAHAHETNFIYFLNTHLKNRKSINILSLPPS